MKVYRITRSKYSKVAFSGDGSRRYPGRWHAKGTALVYTSESRSLAVLESLVHCDPEDLPSDLVFISAEIPEDCLIEIAAKDLPRGWRTTPPPDACSALVSNWIAEGSSLALKVPSVVVPKEWNILINPDHPDFPKLKIAKAEAHCFDSRLAK